MANPLYAAEEVLSGRQGSLSAETAPLQDPLLAVEVTEQVLPETAPLPSIEEPELVVEMVVVDVTIVADAPEEYFPDDHGYQLPFMPYGTSR